MSEIKFPDIMLDNTFIYKGAITDNYVAQELTSKEESLYYWTSKRSAEILLEILDLKIILNQFHYMLCFV